MDATDDLIAELQKIPWFQELKPQHIRKIADISRLRRYKAGEVFFHEGDKQDDFYVVLEGRVALEMFIPSLGRIRFYTVEPWDIFGWSSVTPTVRLRTAGAVAVKDGAVIGTDAEQLRQLCEQDHDLGYRVMKRLANVIASRLTVTRLQLLDMFAKPMETKNE
jgi:CRP/FNR family cyclic AMP-dependent transcriptional regulator